VITDEYGVLIEWYLARGKLTYSEKNLPQCDFVYHKHHMNYLGTQSSFLRRGAGD
jgi:hypothetical protein